jgi:acetyl-CoA carboxylase carboxyl transferase subunit beta
MDFKFLGGSMGSVVGEKLTRLIERATEKELPIIIISTSGGARMYEGMLSLMQMAKTCGALAYHARARLPYISILTDPTYAGVVASFATVGDLILAEPGAMIGFAGPRVIKDTTQAELPPGFQTAEFLLDHGLIDAIVSRKETKARLIEYLNYLMAGGRR